MFAILKFQQRTNTATFSHAFVLTIRICPSSEHSLFDLKYPIVKETDADTTFKDLNVSLDIEDKIISTVISATDEISPKRAVICQTEKIDEISKYNGIENMLNEVLKTTINSNFQDNIRDSTICENLDERIESATITTKKYFNDAHNTEFYNNVQENKPINCNTEKCEKNVEQCSIDCIQEQSLRAKKTDEIEIKKAHDIKEEKETKLIVMQKQNQQVQDIQKYKISSSLESSPSGIMNANKWLLSNKFNFEKSIVKDNTCTINNTDNLTNNNEMISEDINPSNVPYQYFIEKEIKDTKPNLIINQTVQKNLQTEIKNINKDCIPKMIKGNNKSIHIKQKDYYNNMTNLESQENDRQHTKTSMNIDDKQLENNKHNKSYKARKQKSKESERKTIPDKVLRSSNITDLVMEGLMFTIRQDQDSIAVIEQKTKLEMDEVLENSEKVETKAGEKCLLNSSLLRLENLVTMIDSSHNKDKQYKNHHVISNVANQSSFNVFSNDAVNNVNINYVDTGIDKLNVSNYDRHDATNRLNLYQSRWQHQCIPSNIKNNDGCSASGISIKKREQLMEWQGSNTEQDKKYKNDEMEKQGDIIPENNITSPSNKINSGLRNTNSLMINKNIEEINKLHKSTEGHYSSLLSYSLLDSSKVSTKTISVISKESSLMKLPQQEANIPKIVSDKAITIEQMPPALQKVLRHTYKSHRFPSTISSEMFQQNEQKMQYKASTRDTISEADILLEDKCIDPNIANNSLSITVTIGSEKIRSNNEKSCVTIDKDVPKTNKETRVKNSKRKDETRRILRRSSSSKHGSPRKLQDITEEFYYDLLHVHNKDNAIRQRCLRQKQKSLNNLNDIKNGKVRIEMLKFIQDITEGARVVVRRLNIDNKPNLLEKNF